MLVEKLGLRAELRNPDEFYHKMKNARLEDGEHKVVLKTNQEKTRQLHEKQDLALVNLKRTVEAKKADKLQSSLHLIDFPKDNTHIKFISSAAELHGQSRHARKPFSNEN